MILTWIFGETELIFQVPTILSEQIQAWIVDGVSTKGEDKVKVSFMNPNLFLASKAFQIDLAQVG